MPTSICRESISIVVPVRNEERGVGSRIISLLSLIVKLELESVELIVVDDGSTDRTFGQVQLLQETVPNLRAVRHDRPRGMEASGQTGLERATGQLVIILEDQHEVRIEDMQQLLEVATDHTVVAARSQSTPRRPSTQLLRRLRAWGSDADQQFDNEQGETPYAGLQIVRRSNLHTLSGPKGPRYRLTSDTRKHYVID